MSDRFELERHDYEMDRRKDLRDKWVTEAGFCPKCKARLNSEEECDKKFGECKQAQKEG